MQKILVDEILSRLSDSSIMVNFWDGTSRQYGEGEPQFAVRLTQPLSGLKLAKDPILEIGEAYMDGTIDLDGDLKEVIRWAFNHQNLLPSSPTAKLARQMVSKVRKATNLAQQKKDVQYHYDLGNDFYSLWLDETLSYSCAYFHTTEDSLKQAQLQKIDHILKKLQLKPGETLLDIGSGWGELIIRANQHYQVQSMGITLSEEQYRKTKERIQEAKLDHLVSVKLLDYRQLAESGLAFDKIVNVGMLEHVGKDNLELFLKNVSKLLQPKGLALVHSITKMVEGPVNGWIEKHIFPGGYIPSLREVVWLLPDYDFHVLDIESLRMHYAMTLDIWAENFEANVEEVTRKYGEKFVRMWRLYLYSCAESFRTSGLDVHQILFSKNLNNSLPLTRKHIYH